MAVVKSEKYPELVIHDLGITLKKGSAIVSDKKKLSALKKMHESYGIVIESEPKQENEEISNEDEIPTEDEELRED